MTQFVDYVRVSGGSRITQAKKIRDALDNHYDPAADYYKQVREAIVENHRTGGSRADLRGATFEPHPKKAENFNDVLAGYMRWWGRKALVWFDPPKARWRSPTGGLQVAVNPELGLEIKGQRHVIKLFFKKGNYTKKEAELVCALMHETLPKKNSYSVLAVRSGKLHTPAAPPRPDLRKLLDAELVGLETLLHGL